VSDITIVYAILIAAVILFVSGKVPVGLVAIGVALALWATGILELEQALGGFGDPTVLFIAALFVVSEGLDATGVTTWAGQQLIDRAGTGRSRLVALTMGLVAVLTALISVNGAVAALLPVVVVMAVRLGRSPSQLLMPLVFGAHAGSMLALTGTPVNVIVSDAAIAAGGDGFGFFEFGLAGLPLLLACIAVVVVLGPRLLPVRTPASMPPDLSAHGRTLATHYGLDAAPVVRAGAQTAAEEPRHLDVAAAYLGRDTGLMEVVVPPRSALVGETAFPGMVTDSGDLVVLAVQRQGEDIGPREVRLRPGDALLLQGSWEAIGRHSGDDQVLVVDSPEIVRRQAVPLGRGAGRAIVILGLMVLALATGIVPSAVAGLLAAGAMVVFGVLTPEASHRAISWTTVILVAGMTPLSAAMTQTGAADVIASGLVSVVGDLGPTALLAGLFIITAVFGQLISNMATALIMIPIAISASTELGVSIEPVLMSLTFAASAAYLTPIATPVNLMVMAPAGYRFTDYWKLGLPLLGVTFLVAVFLVPVIWPF